MIIKLKNGNSQWIWINIKIPLLGNYCKVKINQKTKKNKIQSKSQILFIRNNLTNSNRKYIKTEILKNINNNKATFRSA